MRDITCYLWLQGEGQRGVGSDVDRALNAKLKVRDMLWNQELCCVDRLEGRIYSFVEL